MPFWLILVLVNIGVGIATAILQKPPKDASASGLGDFQAPTAEEGRVIPVVFGTVKIKGPNVVWYGDLGVVPIKKKTGGFFGLFSKDYVSAYKYYLGMQMALCHGPIDSILGITVGDKGGYASDWGSLVTITTNADGSKRWSFLATDLFGGDEREGGISGLVDIFLGSTTQNASGYLASKFGGTAPAYRGICYAVLNQLYLGTSNYIKNWAWIVQRCPNGLGLTSNRHLITGADGRFDANPACVMYEVLTNTTWGLGIPAARMDTATLQAVGNTLYTEGTGVSIVLDGEISADQFLSELCRHVDMVIYTEPTTGLWTAKLIRADYSVGALTEYTIDDILEVPEHARGSWSETVNEVKVEFVDRSNDFQIRLAQAQETANYATQSQKASSTQAFHGLSSAAVANRVAMRVLKGASYPLMKVRLKLKRKAWSLRPGQVFKLTYSPLGITGMVVRVTNIQDGRLDDGAMTVDVAEDIFSVANTAYAPPSGTGWTDPSNAAAQAVTAQTMIELPYHYAGDSLFALAMATRADGVSLDAELWSNEGPAFPGFYKSNTMPVFTPSGTLSASYGAYTAAKDLTGFTLAVGSRDVATMPSTDSGGVLRGELMALIGGTEIVSCQTVTDNGNGTYTISGVLRGVLDTVPVDHASGERVWFFSVGSATLRPDAYGADLTVNAKVLPHTPKNTLAIGSATQMSITTASRSRKPYPPGNVSINSTAYPGMLTTTVGDAVLTWAHRHRVTQTAAAAMLPQDSASVSGGQEGTYTVEVYVGGVLTQTFSALTGTSQTYTSAQRVADDSDGSKTVVFRIKPINGSYTGTTRDTQAFTMTGFGSAFGIGFGGANL